MTAERTHQGFASVLDELLKDEAARRAWSGTTDSGLDYLAVVDALHSGRIVISDDGAAAGYREVAEGWTSERAAKPAAAPADSAAPASPAPTAPVAPPPSTDPASIARELGLKDGRFKGDLDALRRRFAFANHPDRVDPSLRVVAMARMQIANMLIDDAKRRALRR